MGDETLLERILDGEEEPKDLPLALLQSITNDFSQDRQIGQGGFGVVYKGVLRNGIIVAVKRMYVNQHTVDDRSFRREINSLMKINHQNVVRFLGFCSHAYHTSIKEAGSTDLIFINVRERLLCLEYINNGSLDKHITDELRGFEWKTRYEIIMGICKGLCYLHEEKEIVHMDLKPANILLDDHMVPKFTDFGLSRPNENSHTMGQRFGTRGYLAPEYENTGRTSVKSDIYSLGAIIIELVTGCMGVPDKINVLRRWRHRWSKPPTLLQYQQVTRCIDIAARCRQQEPGHRPSITEIISTLTGSESTDGQSDQVSPCFDEDDMLGIKPLELHLPSELKEEISCFTVQLTNDTHNYIAFNIQLLSGQRYSAQPYKGIVQPESKCGVKIIVQARDVHEHAHADKFIVQSMKVSKGHRYEDITERMFEEASEVVDEVNLMVVYERAKPQENCKSREDANMPAEEVPKAKKRKIVKSASVKGKLVSSENAEASLVGGMRGHCTEQTEQCKFYTPQSFSRHYPTNTTYLGKGSRAVDVTRGAMGSLLDKLGKLVKEDYNLERSMKRDIESFSEDLAKIHTELPNLGKLDGVEIWVDEVRELSYNIEDMIDSFVVCVEPASSRSGFRELRHEGLKFLENDMMTQRQIGDVIRDIKNQVQAVADRKKKYSFNVNNVAANATAKADIDLRISAIYEDKEQLIGIGAPRDELIRLFKEDGNVSKLKTISIVGLGGLGKTTLAKAVYDKLKAQYHPKTFVPVGQNPDVKTILKNIIIDCQSREYNAERLEYLDARQLINELQKLLEDKRYFIVIDDIWDSSSWDLIASAFPKNNHGSRVITTTRIERVALHCCKVERKYVYRMKSLGEEDSRRLFLRRIFGTEKDCPDTPRKEEISKYILKKCGGMPLAINSIASLLAGEEESTWEYIWKSLGSVTEGDDLENVKQILDLSYILLPDHLKTCLLYVCMYPEDREIFKNDLLRKWVAEGFVHLSRNGGLDAEDVAEKYFKELINMCMIQPGKIDVYSNEVLSCRVHDIILDLMRSKSSKENFIHVIDGSKDGTGENRRVLVQYNDEEDTRISETINKRSLSHVRSVLLCRISLVPYFLEFKYVRVLHIEHAYSSQICGLDLTCISRLFLLRYLKIACIYGQIFELKLPNQIGKLQQLETIDIAGAILENAPSDIVSLPWLSHLSLYRLVLPDGIDMLKFLCTLDGVCLHRSSVENIKGLGKLTNLRKLGISSNGSGRNESVEETTMDALHYSICKLSANLRTFTFDGGLDCIPDVSGWITRTPFPRGSHIRELDLLGYKFERCPEWIGQLHGLYKLCISVREVADGVSIVARLPSLAYFYLSIPPGMGEEEGKEESVVIPGIWEIPGMGEEEGKEERLPSLAYFYLRSILDMGESVVIPGAGSGAFKALKHLVFGCEKVSLIFEAGAMPKLEKLEILFRHDMAPQFLPVGIQHLPTSTLKQISLHVALQLGGWDAYREDETTYVRQLLEGAFKPHHPAADITINGTKLLIDVNNYILISCG